jgi:sugar/nucleoside kinase (ribokinase family)
MTAGASVKPVIGLGLATLDQLLLWEDARKPVAENRMVDHDVQGGGMVATAMVAVARLGGRAEYWGAVGDDWMGRMIVEGLVAEGVETSEVRVVPGQRGPLVVVSVDRVTGSRKFCYWVGVPEVSEPIGRLDRLAEAGCLLVDGGNLPSALRAAAEARRLGVPIVSDVGRITDKNRPLMELVDYAVLSQMCAESLTGGDDYEQACRQVAEMGPSRVVVTLGEKGLLWRDGERFGRMDAFAVEAVDTTGAGDTFHGAFCQGLVDGLGFTDNLAFASATAALKCRRLGGRAGIPTRPEVVEFLAQRGIRLTQ